MKQVREVSNEEYWIRRVVVLILLFALLTAIFGAGRLAINAISGVANPAPSPTKSNSPKSTTKAVHACADSDIKVTVSVDSKEIAPGQSVSVTADFVNASTQKCLRDTGALANEIYLQSRTGKKVWSSDFCPTNNDSHLASMPPGAIFRISVTWPGTRKPPKCGEVADPIKPGVYQAFARNGAAISEPATITVK